MQLLSTVVLVQVQRKQRSVGIRRDTDFWSTSTSSAIFKKLLLGHKMKLFVLKTSNEWLIYSDDYENVQVTTTATSNCCSSSDIIINHSCFCFVWNHHYSTNIKYTTNYLIHRQQQCKQQQQLQLLQNNDEKQQRRNEARTYVQRGMFAFRNTNNNNNNVKNNIMESIECFTNFGWYNDTLFMATWDMLLLQWSIYLGITTIPYRCTSESLRYRRHFLGYCQSMS